MKPGEIRRFIDDINALGAEHLAGHTFVVLAIDNDRTETVSDWRTSFLLGGTGLEEGWRYAWVKDNSEAL